MIPSHHHRNGEVDINIRCVCKVTLCVLCLKTTGVWSESYWNTNDNPTTHNNDEYDDD